MEIHIMAELKLSNEEAQTLKELLQHKLTDLDVEIHRTDTMDFKNQLRHRRDLLKSVSDRLPSGSDVSPQI
jgi:hypothetical protein